jgi:hypothetical protein
MKYIIPSSFYFYNLLTGGDEFEDICEQQLFLAEHGVDWTTSDNFMDLEREVAVTLLAKKEKEKMENRNLE